jgi:hypothetical protein
MAGARNYENRQRRERFVVRRALSNFMSRPDDFHNCGGAAREPQ